MSVMNADYMIEELESTILNLDRKVFMLEYEKKILQEQVNRLTGKNVIPVCALCKKKD